MSSLKVLIDGRNMSLPNGTGIATYGRTLAAAARMLGHDVGILLGASSLHAGSGSQKVPGLRRLSRLTSSKAFQLKKLVVARGRASAVPIAKPDANQSGLPACDSAWAIPHIFDLANIYYGMTGRFLEISVPDTPDVMHWTYTIPIRIIGAKNLYTIHDLVPMIMPEAGRLNHRSFYAMTDEIAAKADHILTVSETSKRDIVERLRISSDRVSNTYQSLDLPDDANEMPQEEIRAVVETKHGLPVGDYFLYFGAIEPKKNVARLIQAYLRSGASNPLVIIGKFGWDFEAEAALLADPQYTYSAGPNERPAVARGLKHIDHVARNDLIALVKGAKSVFFPSLYEGFGLPAAEAMRLGAPVLASTKGSLPEICGDGALLVDPYDVDALSAGIARLATDEALRRNLSARGRVQAAQFTLDAFAGRLQNVYNLIYDRSNPRV